MILELNGTKVTIVDKTLGYQGDNLVDTIQVTVDRDSTWNYKLDMYKGKSKCFDSVLMTREGNICTVQLTNEILSYGGRYIFQLRGYTDTQTYHSDIFESWVNASIEYQDDCKQTDCGCDCKLPTEFYQVEDNVTEINNHPPYPGDNNKWMIWDVNKHEYVESDIDVISGGEEYQTKANLTTSVTAQSTDIQYPSAKAVYDAIANASIVTVEITGNGTDSDPYVSSMTFDEIQSAMQAGRTVVGIRPSSNPAFFIAFLSFSKAITFTRLADIRSVMDNNIICESYTISKDGYITHTSSQLEGMVNKVTSLSADSTNVQYPSAKAVYDAIQNNGGTMYVNVTSGSTITADKTYLEISAAVDSGKTVIVRHSNSTGYDYFALTSLDGVNATFYFTNISGNTNRMLSCSSTNWWNFSTATVETLSNKITALSASSTNVQYPSAKAVYDAIQAAKPEIVTPTAESVATQAASAKAVWDMLGTGGSGTDISLGVTGAAVGDIIKVKAVDADGKPTEWVTANSAVEIANGVDVSAVSSFEYSTDLAGNAITSNHLKLVLCAPNLQDTQKWLNITINDLRLRVYCYFNSFWVCDIKILKDFICFTLGKSGFSTTAEGTYTSAGINKIEETYVIATATDYTNLNKMISCQYNYGINNPAWGESAQLWIWGE